MRGRETIEAVIAAHAALVGGHAGRVEARVGDDLVELVDVLTNHVTGILQAFQGIGLFVTRVDDGVAQMAGHHVDVFDDVTGVNRFRKLVFHQHLDFLVER